MTTQTIDPTPAATESLLTAETDAARAADGRVRGLRCRNCGRLEALGPSYVCAACFGPLEVTYDYARIRAEIERATIEARPSKGSTYLGLTITVTATSREQLDELYRTLSTHPMVKVVI